MATLCAERLLHRAGRGSTETWVAAASDGERYVIKFRAAGPGPFALVAEFVVGRLAGHWGYPVPEVRPVWLDARTPRVGTDEFWDVLDGSVGWNLAVRWIPDAENVRLAEPPSLPANVLSAMFTVDVLFANFDRTTLSDNLIRDALGDYWLIDHGSCRFADYLDDTSPAFELAPNHFLRGSERSRALPPPIDEAQLRRLLDVVPREWLAAIDLSFERLVMGLAHRIEAFAS